MLHRITYEDQGVKFRKQKAWTEMANGKILMHYDYAKSRGMTKMQWAAFRHFLSEENVMPDFLFSDNQPTRFKNKVIAIMEETGLTKIGMKTPKAWFSHMMARAQSYIDVKDSSSTNDLKHEKDEDVKEKKQVDGNKYYTKEMHDTLNSLRFKHKKYEEKIEEYKEQGYHINASSRVDKSAKSNIMYRAAPVSETYKEALIKGIKEADLKWKKQEAEGPKNNGDKRRIYAKIDVTKTRVSNEARFKEVTKDLPKYLKAQINRPKHIKRFFKSREDDSAYNKAVAALQKNQKKGVVNQTSDNFYALLAELGDSVLMPGRTYLTKKGAIKITRHDAKIVKKAKELVKYGDASILYIHLKEKKLRKDKKKYNYLQGSIESDDSWKANLKNLYKQDSLVGDYVTDGMFYKADPKIMQSKYSLGKNWFVLKDFFTSDAARKAAEAKDKYKPLKEAVIELVPGGVTTHEKYKKVSDSFAGSAGAMGDAWDAQTKYNIENNIPTKGEAPAVKAARVLFNDRRVRKDALLRFFRADLPKEGNKINNPLAEKREKMYGINDDLSAPYAAIREAMIGYLKERKIYINERVIVIDDPVFLANLKSLYKDIGIG
jgi:hypothetical protein